MIDYSSLMQSIAIKPKKKNCMCVYHFLAVFGLTPVLIAMWCKHVL